MGKLYDRLFKIYEFIEAIQVDFNYSPSLDDIAVAMSMSKDTVLDHLDTMEFLGMIERPTRQIQAIRLLSKELNWDALLFNEF